jgi:hypothetical protein
LSRFSGIKLGPEKNCTETSLTSSFDFLQIDDLSEGAALDLVAVLSGNELLVVGLVFAGHESFGKLKSRALGQTNIASKGTNFTGNFLHALFALNNCGVDFVNTFDNIGPGIFITGMTLPSNGAEGYKGWEKEGETSQNENTHNDGGKVREGFFLIARYTIRLSRGTISGFGGSV